MHFAYHSFCRRIGAKEFIPDANLRKDAECLGAKAAAIDLPMAQRCVGLGASIQDSPHRGGKYAASATTADEPSRQYIRLPGAPLR